MGTVGGSPRICRRTDVNQSSGLERCTWLSPGPPCSPRQARRRSQQPGKPQPLLGTELCPSPGLKHQPSLPPPRDSPSQHWQPRRPVGDIQEGGTGGTRLPLPRRWDVAGVRRAPGWARARLRSSGTGQPEGKGPTPAPDAVLPPRLVTCRIKRGRAGGAASGGGYKGGCSRSCPRPARRARMVAMLPSLALALLCQPRAGAEVPVQPDLSTEKVTAGGAHPSRAAWGTSPRAAPLGEPGTPGYPWVLSWHQGSFQESFQGGGDAHAKLSWPWQLLPAVARLSGVPTAGTPAPGAVTSPRSRCSPRERGPDAAPGSWHSAGQGVPHSGGRRVPCGGWQVSEGGRSPWQVAGPTLSPDPLGVSCCGLQGRGTLQPLCPTAPCS